MKRDVLTRWGALTGLVCVLALAPLAACTGSASATEDAKARTAKPVRVIELGRSDIADVLIYVADLEPKMEVSIYSTLMDRIISFPWEDGDEIDEGERVAQIRSVGLSKGLQGLSAQMDGLDAQIRNTRAEGQRSRELLQRGVLTQSQFDQIQTGLTAAEANRRALDANRGQLAVTAGNAYIRAPISGVIANKSVEAGDTAVPQMPLCRIIAVDKLKANLRMVESEVPKVKIGQAVKLHVDAYPGRTFEGKVTNIMPFLDAATRTNLVEVMIDNPKHPETEVRALKPGMYGRAELVVGMHKNVLVAPEPALLLDNRLLDKQKPGEILRKAYVVKNGKAVKRLVKLGARTGSSYEILDGLEEGEQLIVRGQHGLKDDAEVEVVGATPGANGKGNG